MDKKEQKEEYHFVKEKTKKMPVDKKKRGRSLLWTAILGAVFGVAAALVFCCLRPLFTSYMQTQEEEEVTLSGEEEEEEEEQQDTVYITETQQMELSDYQILQNKLYAVGREANQSVVSVTGIKSTQDWFDAEYVSEGEGAGIIIAETGQKYLIVTEKKLIADANAIEVEFYDEASADAELVAYDGNTGIAVLSVDKSLLSADTLEMAAVAQLNGSSTLTQGTMVIAIGSPLGEAFSILTGNVTSSNHEVTTTDANYQVISTDISGTENSSGALINLNGEIVGLIMQSYSREENQNTLTALSIADLRSLVEKLSNGNTPAYLGLEISTVTEKISEEYDLPKGVYIRDVLMDSPGMEAGLQTGDIIIKIEDTEITTEDEYEEYLLEAKAGQMVSVTVKRMGADGSYQDIVCEAMFGTLD